MAHRCEIRETELCPQDSVWIEAFPVHRIQVRLQQSEIEFYNRWPAPPESFSEENQIFFSNRVIFLSTFEQFSISIDNEPQEH